MLIAMVTALTAATLTVGLAATPAAAAPDTTRAAAASTTDGAEIQVKRGLFFYLSFCMAAGAAGVAAGEWDRWLCSPQFIGWRLYTNR